MPDASWLPYAAGGLFAAGGVVLWLARRTVSKPNLHPRKEAAETGRLPVLDGLALIAATQLSPWLSGIRDRMGYHQGMFDKDCLPVILSAAEWAQMLPASESHHHAQPGGLLTHMIESAAHALRFRQGYLLPVGAAPEEIPERKHRWTYAVFLSALLHDIGRPMADINVRAFRSNKACGKWQPLAGSMLDQGMTHYTLDFETSRDYDLHRKLPIVLFQRLVPQHVLAWLAEDVQLMGELSSYLSGEEQYKGALREIITRADSESVKNNLMHGPRTRFATAKTVPLIERLMQALRLMLDEGHLSLNRAGSHGWVHDGKIWFVSKRLADEVRQFLVARESGEGVPGKDKNDRLFDTWQEYGALVPTEDNRAVWNVTVSLEDGWTQTLTVLCFSLDKLFQHPGQYPESVRGTVAPLQHGASVTSDLDNSSSGSGFDTSDISDKPDSGSTEENPGLELEPSQANPPVAVDAQKPTTDRRESSFALPALNTRPARSLPERQSETPPSRKVEDEFLNDEDAARPKPKIKAAAVLKPVAPAGLSQSVMQASARKPPSGAALRFMRWIQEGLAEGNMAYNRSDAMIHFVEDGMMLVSPLIFRRFAELFGEDGEGTPSDKPAMKLGTGIQRQVTNAGWHLVSGDKKSNIQRYTVIGADGQGKKLISGVVIVDPARFVNPLPANNPCIVRFEQALEHA